MIRPLLRFLARRFVAGETAASAVDAAKRMNAAGIKAVIDFLGEDVRSEQMAAAAANEYITLLDLIHSFRVDAHVSVKLSQMGLLVSRESCFENVARIVAAASKHRNFVWFDMEGSDLTQKTIETFEKVRTVYPNVGLCLQSSLVRTGGDLDRLMRFPLNVRLCKGAYKEPPQIAYATKRAVDGNYRILVQKLLEHVKDGVYPAFATHDGFMIDYITAIAREQKVELSQFEFEMLYGIRSHLLQTLARRGFQTRVYIPYGRSWFPYFVRRLRERKENLFFVLKNIFRR